MSQQSNPTPLAPAPLLESEAQKFAEEMAQIMDALLSLSERETELVKAGNIREAMALEGRKADLSRQYLKGIGRLKVSQPALRKVAPDLLKTLHRHHETFRSRLQMNLTVLATAHAVSEGLIRGVNGELQRRNTPQTYTATGTRAVPNRRHAVPLSVSRSM